MLSNKIIPIKKKSKINEYDARKNVEIKEQSSDGFKIPKNAALWKKAYSLALYSVSFRVFWKNKVLSVPGLTCGRINCFYGKLPPNFCSSSTCVKITLMAKFWFLAHITINLALYDQYFWVHGIFPIPVYFSGRKKNSEIPPEWFRQLLEFRHGMQS